MMRRITKSLRSLNFSAHKVLTCCISRSGWSMKSMSITIDLPHCGKKLCSLSGVGSHWFTISMRLSDLSTTPNRCKISSIKSCLASRSSFTCGLLSTTLLSLQPLTFSLNMNVKRLSRISSSSYLESTWCSQASGRSMLFLKYKRPSITISYSSSISGISSNWSWVQLPARTPS